MRIAIDDEILSIYEDLPEVFKMKDVKERLRTRMPLPTLHVNLERMVKSGLASRIEIPNKKSRRYHKNFKSLKEWFEVCVVKPLREKRKEEVVKV
ncbi:MAG: hypothetical protein QXL67_05390 [Candidatus Bathyarchaeia archaeon]